MFVRNLFCGYEREIMKLSLAGVAFFVSLMASVNCFAQDKQAIRSDAKEQANKLRQQGEPLDRCSLMARHSEGGVVVDVYEGAVLALGDKIISINGLIVEGESADKIVDVLRKIQPNESIEIIAERNSERMNLKYVCQNSRPYMEVLLAGLDAAGRGKFDECLNHFSSRSDMGAYGAFMKLQCASQVRGQSEYTLANLSVDVARKAISEANWYPENQARVIEMLRNLHGPVSRNLGVAKFQELVDATKSWSNPVASFTQSEPDYALFKRVSERELRSRLIDPDSARIEWPYGFLKGSWKPPFQGKIDGYWTCGRINAKNRMGGYVGSSSFVVVLGESGDIRFVQMGTGRDFDLVSAQCSNSVKNLPPAPKELSDTQSPATSSSGDSIASQLERLDELRKSGALTESEFQSAKRRVLGLDSE